MGKLCLISGKYVAVGFVISALCSSIQTAIAAEAEYETQFLRRDKQGATPDVFVYHNAVTPGLKTVDLFLNDRFIDRYSVLFVDDDAENKVARPCFSTAFLQQLGVRTEGYQHWRQPAGDQRPVDPATLTAGQCEDIAARIPSSGVSYDGSQQTLKIQVPQAAVKRQASAMIAPTQWDDGVANLRTSYTGYVYQTRLNGEGNENSRGDQTNRSAWISLNSTGGLGPWRLYSNDSYSKNEDTGWETNHDSLYLSRGVAAARGMLPSATSTPSRAAPFSAIYRCAA